MVMKMKNKIPNLKLYLIIILVILIGIFLVYKLAFSNSKYTNLVDINIVELETKIGNNDTFILVLSQTGCSHCNQYLPELNRTLSSYDLEAYILNISELDKENSQTLAKYVNFSGTPTTVFFNDGEEKTTLNRLVGYASKNKIVERLKSLGYID